MNFLRLPNAFLVLSLVIIISIGSAAQTASHDLIPSPPGSLVNVNGIKIHIHCAGEGRPTVVLIHGLGDYSVDWELVQPQVASQAQTCAYDRPAQAWSEPGPPPRGLCTSAHELHLLLRRARVPKPYVLVGHSWGGLIARMYARRFPREVAGIVLVDSSHEDEYLWINGRVVRPRFMDDAAWGELLKPSQKPAPLASSSSSARSPDVPTTPRVIRIPPPYDKLPADAQRLRAWAMSQPFTKARQEGGDSQDMRRDFMAMSEGSRNKAHPLGHIPLIVLSKTPDLDNDDDYTPEQLTWNRELQQRLETLSTNSRHLVADHSGHAIQIDDPNLVIASILRVLDAVREHRQLKEIP